MGRKTEDRYILFTGEVHEKVKFDFTMRQIETFITLWNSGYPIDKIAQKLNTSKVSVALIVMDLEMDGRIEVRPSGLHGSLSGRGIVMTSAMLNYLMHLRTDIKHAIETEIESDKGVITVDSTDFENLEQVIKEWKCYRETLRKIQGYMQPGIRMRLEDRDQRIVDLATAALCVSKDTENVK